jgi:hypothetical protein
MSVTATLWNSLTWFANGSSFTRREDDLLKQGQAKFADPVGNFKDTDVEHHVATKSELKANENGATTLNVDQMDEINGVLIITPKIDWYVRSQFKHTTVVKMELQHVSRYLYWLGDGDGGAAIRNFNRHPTGSDRLKKTIKKEADAEWLHQYNNMDGNRRHSLDKNPAQSMNPAEIRNAIENVQPREEPWLYR